MKTICFFNSTKAWGGGEKWHFETCKYLNSLGHPVFVIAHLRGELYKRVCETNIRCIGMNVGNLSFLNLFKVKAITKILHKNNVETIIINLSRDLKLAGLASKRADLKRIIYRRGSAIPIKNSWLNRYYFKNIVTEVLANSQATKLTVLANNDVLFPKDKIKVIYNGIEIDEFLRQKVHPVYQKEGDEIVLSNLGRLEFQKNQKFLIRLAAELRRRELKFKIIIGGEGRLRDELQNLSKKLQVQEYIVFTGFIKNPSDLICSSDIFILSSLWEGFGYVLAEAALCKKPVVAFNCSSNPEVVINKSTGFLTPIDDIEAFADKVEYLIEHPKKRKEMGEKGFGFIHDNFDSEKIQEKLVNYLTHG